MSLWVVECLKPIFADYVFKYIAFQTSEYLKAKATFLHRLAEVAQKPQNQVSICITTAKSKLILTISDMGKGGCTHAC